VIKAGAARGVQKWRFFDFPTEQIEQPQLMLVEILRIERNHQLPSSIATVADRRDDAHHGIMR
jgi:hypothetical protein